MAAENETYAFDGDFTTGAYVSGNYRLLQRAVYPFVVPAGATSIRATLTFDARAGDLDFHLETPEPIIYGDGSGHGGTAAAPEAGVIDVPAEDAVAGNWTVVVHTGEAEPASFNLDGSYRIDVVVTILRAAPPLRC